MTPPIAAPWPRRSYQPTGRDAEVLLVVFSGELGAEHLTAPVDGLEIRRLRGAEAREWRTGAARELATRQLGDLGRLDAATEAYAVRVTVNDPPDLGHLQLAWAAAARLAAARPSVVLDVLGAAWHPGDAVATRAPDRPFAVTAEITVVVEWPASRRFGHAVHTRGMTKFARPDLIAGVPESRIHDTARILNHLAAMLADGAVLTPGQRLRFDGRRTLLVQRYQPGRHIPDVRLADDGLLLVDR